ncbi:MAG: hypothetical protein IPK77_11390 [Cellvibrio sp.]|nr:hypothetical protein [Cellvibrio sp.]
MTQNNAPTTTFPTQKNHKGGVWDWLLSATIGTFFRFVWWSIAAIFIASYDRVGRHDWFWGPEHSKHILKTNWII